MAATKNNEIRIRNINPELKDKLSAIASDRGYSLSGFVKKRLQSILNENQ
jgi:hypothetical protein